MLLFKIDARPESRASIRNNLYVYLTDGGHIRMISADLNFHRVVKSISDIIEFIDREISIAANQTVEFNMLTINCADIRATGTNFYIRNNTYSLAAFVRDYIPISSFSILNSFTFRFNGACGSTYKRQILSENNYRLNTLRFSELLSLPTSVRLSYLEELRENTNPFTPNDAELNRVTEFFNSLKSKTLIKMNSVDYLFLNIEDNFVNLVTIENGKFTLIKSELTYLANIGVSLSLGHAYNKFGIKATIKSSTLSGELFGFATAKRRLVGQTLNILEIIKDYVCSFDGETRDCIRVNSNDRGSLMFTMSEITLCYPNYKHLLKKDKKIKLGAKVIVKKIMSSKLKKDSEYTVVDIKKYGSKKLTPSTIIYLEDKNGVLIKTRLKNLKLK
jgi:hypothetical protein